MTIDVVAELIASKIDERQKVVVREIQSSVERGRAQDQRKINIGVADPKPLPF